AGLRPRGMLAWAPRADRGRGPRAPVHGPRFGSRTLVPLWPKAGEEARRILLAVQKGGRSPARFTAGLVLHGPDGAYGGQAQRILRDMDPLIP
ncbi:methyltransferase, partial [Azospirillum brasilense]|nr:methyltransferase [Azospirillum brasilense]